MLAKNPGFSTVAILVLALGIGANSAIFSLVNAMLLKPLPLARPGELAGIYSEKTTPPGGYRAISYPNYRDLRDSATVFTGLAAHNVTLVGVGEGTVTRRVFVDVVSANYFETFGSPLALGRAFTPTEEEPDANLPVVIVSHAYWEREGRSPDILGDSIRVNGDLLTIVGVAGEGFAGSSVLVAPELWLPLGLYGSTTTDILGGASQSLADRDNHTLIVVGRLRAGLTPAMAAPELAAIAARLEQAYPSENEDRTFRAATLPRLSVSTNPTTDGQFSALSFLMMAMSGVVLLIACLNLANMLLARGAARRREIAIRLSLGGGRGRVIRQLLAEGFVLSVLGGAVGLVVAAWAVDLLVRSIETILPFSMAVFGVGTDWRVVTGTLGFCLLGTVVFGLFPAWQLTRGDILSDLKQQANPDRQRRRGLLAPRNLLIVGQVALSLALLTAGGLFLRGAVAASTADPGFAFAQGLLLETDPSLVGYDEPRGRAVYQALLARLRALPGVEAASFASLVPFGAFSEGRGVEPVGATGADGPQSRSAIFTIVGRDYFRSLGLSMLRGREFTDAEEQADTPPAVAIVDVTLAQALWPDSDPLGQQIRFRDGPIGRLSDPLSVVGLAPRRRNDIFDQQPTPTVYAPFGWQYRANMHVDLRLAAGGRATAQAMLRTVREEVRVFDERLPVLALKTLEDFRADSAGVWVVRAGASVFTTFGALALFLAVIGLYAVKAYAVSRRTREIGIRMALDAGPSDVLWMVLREGVVLTLAGLAVGLLLSVGTARLLASLLYEVSTLDPMVFLLAPLVLAASMLLASYLPARRATRVVPMVALRDE